MYLVLVLNGVSAHDFLSSLLLFRVYLGIFLSHTSYVLRLCLFRSLINKVFLIKKKNLVLVQVRRLKEFGVTRGELTRYMDALLKDSEHLAALIDNVSSVDNLDFIMESDALGHTVMDQRQGHESLVAVAGTVTLEEVISFVMIILITICCANQLSSLSLFTF